MPTHVMIAEDSEHLVKVYKMRLEKSGYEVTSCKNGIEAVAAMDKRQPDLLLLDLMMPELDGMGVLEHIQKKGYTFPVIMLTNIRGEMDKEKCIALGAKDYLVKLDLDEDQLLEKLHQYIV
jgi:chemosensory pili system protein ChpA (sensor histidine kinase/response regulator)